MSAAPGRSCPVRYRYGARALSSCQEQSAATLYVIGGLYGNPPALETIKTLAAQEPGPVTLCFNGDFNWFNVDDGDFDAINRSVLEHDACLGNVEAELLTPDDTAGCGCAYPDSVDADVVARSNAIHARLKTTAQRHSELLAQLRSLPMVRRYRVGEGVVGVVHGDAESLAGWRFAVTALHDDGNREWLKSVFKQAGVDVFASTHTCLPALRCIDLGDGRDGRQGIVINNGAAGMPNFAGDRAGLITRIGLRPSPHPTCHGSRLLGLFIDALPVNYDHEQWRSRFLNNWPVGSSAHDAYWERITNGPQ